MSGESNKEQDHLRMQAAIDLLSEHFDTVQIFCTKHEPVVEEGTVGLAHGCGNFHARYGQVREWVIKQDERTREAVRKEG